MRVLLINPTSHADHFRSEGIKLIPYGLVYLATYGREHGHEFRILDRNVDSTSVESVLAEFQPDVVGVTVMTGPCLTDAMQISKHVRTRHPGVKVIWGGVHPTLLHESVLQEDLCDLVVISEGEETLVELLDRLQAGRPWTDVRGIAYRDGAQVVKTPLRPYLTDLNHLPDPAWDLVPMRKYSFYTLNTSRGCPFRCTFCYNQNMNGKRRAEMSAQRVLHLVRRLHTEYGAAYVNFLEDNFTGTWGRVTEFCELMSQSNLAVVWACEGRLTGMTRQRLAALKNARCRSIRFGVESGSTRILSFLKKDITLEQIHQVLADCREVGLESGIYLINGVPTETKGDRDASLRLLYSARPDSVEVTTYRPYPGTKLYEFCLENGLYKAPSTTQGWANFSDQYDPHSDVSGAGCRELTRYQLRASLYMTWKATRWNMPGGPLSWAWRWWVLSSLPQWIELTGLNLGLPPSACQALGQSAGWLEQVSRSAAGWLTRPLRRLKTALAGGPPETLSRGWDSHRRPIRAINLETSRACNLRCVQCATHSPDAALSARPKVSGNDTLFLSAETFARITPILDQVAVVNLDNHGEPLLNRNLEEIIRQARQAGPHLNITMTSNFSLMDRARAKSLLEAGLDQLQVSVNGITKETYEKIMQGASYERFLENLAGFAAVRKQVPNRLTSFAACMTTMRANIDELVRLPAFLAPFGVNTIRVNTILPFNETVRSQSLYDAPGWSRCRDLMREAAREAQAHNMSLHHAMLRPSQEACGFPREGFSISHDGEVCPCWMLDIRGGYRFYRQDQAFDVPFVSFGNVWERDIREIWNSHEFVQYREQFHKNRPPEYCQTCPVGQKVICG